MWFIKLYLIFNLNVKLNIMSNTWNIASDKYSG